MLDIYNYCKELRLIRYSEDMHLKIFLDCTHSFNEVISFENGNDDITTYTLRKYINCITYFKLGYEIFYLINDQKFTRKCFLSTELLNLRNKQGIKRCDMVNLASITKTEMFMSENISDTCKLSTIFKICNVLKTSFKYGLKCPNGLIVYSK